MIKRIIEKLSIKKAFNSEARAYLYDSLGFRVKHGLSLSNSLRKYGDAYSKEGKSIGKYINEIASVVNAGRPLKSAFSKFIPNNELIIISSGDDDVNKMSGAFFDASFMCEKQDELNKAFKKVMKSFIFKLLLILGFMIGMSFMISDVIESLEIKSLPWYSQGLLDFSNHIESYWWAWIVGFVVMVLIVRKMMPNYVGRARSFLSRHIFPFNAYRAMISSSFLISFASLTNGRSQSDALRSIGDSADPYLQSHVHKMYEEAVSGMSSEVIYDVDLFDSFLKINLVDTVESTESAENIKKLAQREMKLSAKKFEKVNTFLNSIVFVLMVMSIIWCYISLVIPVFDMISKQLT